MPEVQCPVPVWDYKTPDVDVVIVAALITGHGAAHPAAPPVAPVAAAKIERVRRPTISAASICEDWSYFQSRCKDYVDTTKDIGLHRFTPTQLETHTPPCKPENTDAPEHAIPSMTRTAGQLALIQTPFRIRDTPSPLTNKDTRRQLTKDSPNQSCYRSTLASETPTATTPTMGYYNPAADIPSTPRISTGLKHAPTWQKDYDMN